LRRFDPKIATCDDINRGEKILFPNTKNEIARSVEKSALP